MGVQELQSVRRAFTTLEAIATHQPVGLTELCHLLEEDKSAMQRVLVTLAGAGWIRPAPVEGARWELSDRPVVVAGQAQRRSGFLARVRPAIEQLRDATGESVLLAAPDGDRFVVVDVAESRQLVRSVPRVGMVLPNDRSAAALACYAQWPDDQVAAFLGRPPDAALAEEIARTRRRGWALNHGRVDPGLTSIAAPVVRHDGVAIASLVLSAPSDRIPRTSHARIAGLVAAAARDAGDPVAGDPAA